MLGGRGLARCLIPALALPCAGLLVATAAVAHQSGNSYLDIPWHGAST
jgi:hypothetical protein